MNCNSRNVIYILKCDACSLTYIGETELLLRLRMNLHRNHNNTKNSFMEVNLHLRRCSKSNFKYTVFPIYQLKQDDSKYV